MVVMLMVVEVFAELCLNSDLWPYGRLMPITVGAAVETGTHVKGAATSPNMRDKGSSRE